MLPVVVWNLNLNGKIKMRKQRALSLKDFFFCCLKFFGVNFYSVRHMRIIIVLQYSLHFLLQNVQVILDGSE